ncbi:SPOR domain-containing protein [Chloroflexota bacterium]
MNSRVKVWHLKRQDDHGNLDTVDAFNSEEEARKMMVYYERKGHKQMYWVERCENTEGEE